MAFLESTECRCDQKSATRAIAPASAAVLLQGRYFLLFAYLDGISFVSTLHGNIQREINSKLF